MSGSAAQALLVHRTITTRAPMGQNQYAEGEYLHVCTRVFRPERVEEGSTRKRGEGERESAEETVGQSVAPSQIRARRGG